MIYYLIFALVCLCVGIFDEWDAGIDLIPIRLLGLVIISLFPVMNLMMLANWLLEIYERRFSSVILKGKK